MNILVTALGTVSATSIARRLKLNSDVKVYGADINPANVVYASTEVDEYFRFPSVVNNPSYLDFIRDFCATNEVDLVIPIIDEEMELLTMNEGSFSEIGCHVLSPGKRAVDVCRNKFDTFEFIKGIAPEIYVPTEYLRDYQDQFLLPVFVKPVSGRASIDCHRIDDATELDYFRAKQGLLSELIIQPLCVGSYVSVDLIRDARTSRVKMAIRRELLRNANGAAIAVEFVENSVLEGICEKVAASLDVNGVINIEFFEDGDTYRLIEINPRFPAGTEFTCLAGLDIVNEWLRIQRGLSMTNSEARVGKRYLRRYETYEWK